MNSVQQLSFAALIQNLPVLVNVNDKWDVLSCPIRQLRLATDELIIKSLKESQENAQVNSSDCIKTISVTEGTICPEISASLFYQNESFQHTIRSENLHFENVKLQQHYLVRVQVKEKNLPILKVMRFKPFPFPKTDTALRALEDFLMSYKQKPEKLEFIGYYKAVPIGSAKKYVIMNKDLILELTQKQSKRVDIFVFKSANEYLFRAVSQK